MMIRLRCIIAEINRLMFFILILCINLISEPKVLNETVQVDSKNTENSQDINKSKTEDESSAKDMEQTLDRFSSSIFDEALEKAATKIQCTYRGFKTRKSLKSNSITLRKKVQEEVKNSNEIDQKVDTAIETGAKIETGPEPEVKPETNNEIEVAIETAPELDAKNEEISVEQILEVLDAKPIEIKSGKKSKKKRSRKNSPKQEEPPTIESHETFTSTVPVVSEQEQIAATKIQCTFRGFKTRKDLNQAKKCAD